jgi:Tol biopolymer transport system component
MHILSSENGNELTSFKLKTNLVGGGRFYWTPDGRGIAYIPFNEKLLNIYVQPIDGSPGHYLTKLSEGEIHNFAVSLDGKQIVYSRAKRSTDIILIQNVP